MLTGSIARLALSWQYKSQASYVLRRTRLLLSLPVNICVYTLVFVKQLLPQRC